MPIKQNGLCVHNKYAIRSRKFSFMYRNTLFLIFKTLFGQSKRHFIVFGSNKNHFNFVRCDKMRKIENILIFKCMALCGAWLYVKQNVYTLT